MVSKEMEKITACEALRLPSASINPDTLEAFSFVDIDKVDRKISPFFMSLIQLAAGVTNISDTFNNDPGSNAGM